MKAVISFFFIFAAVISSCHKRATSTAPDLSKDYMIIGARGTIFGNYATRDYYLINNGQLWKAAVDGTYVSGDVSKLNFKSAMPAARYEQVKDLPGAIPAELTDTTFARIGVFWADAGCREVKIRKNGNVYELNFGQDLSTTSPAVRVFVDKIEVLYR